MTGDPWPGVSQPSEEGMKVDDVISCLLFLTKEVRLGSGLCGVPAGV